MRFRPSTLQKVVCWVSKEFISVDDIDIFSIFLFSSNVYNKGISNFNKYCDLMNEVNPPESDITWAPETEISTLVNEKADDLRFAVAIWDMVTRTTSGTDAIPYNEQICNGIEKICSTDKLVPFSEYSSEDELAAKNDEKVIDLQDCLNLFAQPSPISEQPIWYIDSLGLECV